MAKTVPVTMETIEDLGMGIHGWLNHENSILTMDRRRLARELRRVVRIRRRELAKRNHRKMHGFFLTDWWVMARVTCRRYGVRA
jgi:hypothetical protein